MFNESDLEDLSCAAILGLVKILVRRNFNKRFYVRHS